MLNVELNCSFSNVFPRKGTEITGAKKAPMAKLKWILCIHGPASPFCHVSRQRTFPPVSNEPPEKMAWFFNNMHQFLEQRYIYGEKLRSNIYLFLKVFYLIFFGKSDHWSHSSFFDPLDPFYGKQGIWIFVLMSLLWTLIVIKEVYLSCCLLTSQ